jgi:tetratricopeptide (TPR) repeat protein
MRFPRLSLVACALVVPMLHGCAGSHGVAQNPRTVSAVPVAPVHSEEDYATARAEYDALPTDDPSRTARRRMLLDYQLQEANGALTHDRGDEAESALRQALSLYSPEELRRAATNGKALDEVAPLLALAQRFEIAFRKRGAHLEVLTGLVAQLSLGNPQQRADAKKRYDEVIQWLDGAGGGAAVEPDESDSPSGGARVLADLESIAHVLPSPFVIDQLARRYRQPAPAGDAKATGRARQLRELIGEDHHTTRDYELARIFLRVSQPSAARDELRALAKKEPLRGDDNELLQILEKVTAKEATAADWMSLAMFIVHQTRDRGVDDRDVALRVCRDTAQRFEKAVDPRMCVGELARQLEEPVVAMRSLEEARALDPTRREIWEALAVLYEGRLLQLVTEENFDVNRLPDELARVETFHAEAQKRFPTAPLQHGLAAAIYAVGLGYYNAGRIDDAEKYLARSIELEPNRAALELSATIRQKHGDPQRAAVLFERAINADHGEKAEQLYHRAKLRRLLADAIEAAGDAGTAERTRKGAVEDWDVLLELGLQKEIASEAYFERGRALYQLGEREEALRSLEHSIDVMPERGTSYADVISYLVPRGELDEVLDIYHRALGRSEVTDYLKIYCSLWIVDLAQRAGHPADPLAMAYLRSADGAKWYDDLARWATGREPEKDLLAHANTPSRRAEASFYRAMKALREGHPDDAKKLWSDVLKTNMMAFFEYDMAGLYLKTGAPTHPLPIPAHHDSSLRPSDSPTRQQTHADPPPDGSI